MHVTVGYFFCTTGYTKILVGNGNTTNGLTRSVEVIDLSSSDMICDPLPDFPILTERTVRGLDFDDRPIICGGRTGPGLSFYHTVRFRDLAKLNLLRVVQF